MKPTALGAGLPPLMVAADRLAASVSLGVHGRRKAGIGESFWQFRRYRSATIASAAIDWRQSAKSQHLFVREREWEAAQTVWFWRDAIAGHAIRVRRRHQAATAPICCCWRWPRCWCAAASAWRLLGDGRRAGRLAPGADAHRPCAARSASGRATRALPPDAPIARGAQFVWFSDFLAPHGEIERDAPAVARRAWSAIWCASSIRRKRIFPIPAAPVSKCRAATRARSFGRAESVRGAYRARFNAHGETDRALARTAGLDHAPRIAPTMRRRPR